MSSYEKPTSFQTSNAQPINKELKYKEPNPQIVYSDQYSYEEKVMEESCNSDSSCSDDVDPGVFKNIAPPQASKSKKKSIIKLKKIIESSHILGAANLGVQRFNRNELTSLKKYIDSDEEEKEKSNKAKHNKIESSISEGESEECLKNDNIRQYEDEKASTFKCFKKMFNEHKDEHSIKTIQRRIRRKQVNRK